MAARDTGAHYDDSMEFSQDESPTTELAVRRDQARVIQEVQGAIIVAQRFRRNEDEARVKLLRACKRPTFAENAEYEFPRGGNDVSGPSVQLAREAARVWGNIQFGFEIIAEDDVWRSIRAYAWDVETNSKPFQEDRFKKLIQRKNKQTRQTEWVRPDERDLRELTNRRAAICYRNCILQIIPSDLIQEAIDESRATLKNRAAADPDGERKRVLDAFADLNIMPNLIDTILGHPVSQASPAEIAKLRAVYKSIRDGNSTIQDYVQSVNGHDAGVASKTDERLKAIKDNYAKTQTIDAKPQPSSEGEKVGGQPTSHPTEPQETTPSALQSPAAALSEETPAMEPNADWAPPETEAEFDQRTAIESQATPKRVEPSQPLASPAGIFGDEKPARRRR